MVSFRKGEGIEPRLEVGHRHTHQFGYGLAPDLHIFRIGTQSRTVAVGTGGLATIAGLEHTVLYAVLVLVKPPEESVYTLP